jgi:tetratricopeptide (TPR) repeat protein
MPARHESALAVERRRALPPFATLLVALVLGLAIAFPAAGQLRLPDDEPPSPARTRYEALTAYRTGHYAEVLRLTASLGPEPDALLLRGRALDAIGRYREALEAFRASAGRHASGDAAFELGRLLLRLGRRAEGTRTLEPVIAAGRRSDEGEVIGRAARAAHLLGRSEQANALFRDAAALIGDDPALQVAWGELFLDKQNQAEAVRSFRAALMGDRRNPAPFVGVARALLDENSQASRELIARALALNESYVPAYVLLAELELDEDHRDAARQALDQALAVNPSSLEALALAAGMAFVEDRTADFDDTIRRVLAINPRDGEAYRVAGAIAARHYRFDAAVDLVRKAIALDPDNTRAYADLGTDLLRTGDEAGARAALDRAFREDPYDVVSYNLLGLLDSLESFETASDGLITLRLHPDEAAVLGEHALPLAHEALTSLAARYHATITGPILVEIFPRHDDFAVRNVGLPGMIGALGACFGRVVTLDSPRARPPGTFSWQATLWHELAHVVTLQMSGNRIPRWLTEGISVYEERRVRPEWDRNMDLEFADALERDSILGLSDLNHGFMDRSTIGMAYYEASLLVEYLETTYGHAALEAFVRAFADGLDTDEAMRRAYATTLAAIEPAFTAWLHVRFDSIIEARRVPEDLSLSSRTPLEELRETADRYPGFYDAQVRLGDALSATGDARGAYAAWKRAETILPMATGDAGPRARIAQLALQRGDTDEAVTALEGTLSHEGANVEAARQLAALLDGAGQHERASRAWRRVAELDPFDATASAVLGRRALDARDGASATKWFRAALAAGPADRAAAHCDLAESYLATGDASQAKRQVLAALEDAPTYPRAQELLLGIVDGTR